MCWDIFIFSTFLYIATRRFFGWCKYNIRKNVDSWTDWNHSNRLFITLLFYVPLEPMYVIIYAMSISPLVQETKPNKNVISAVKLENVHSLFLLQHTIRMRGMRLEYFGYLILNIMLHTAMPINLNECLSVPVSIKTQNFCVCTCWIFDTIPVLDFVPNEVFVSSLWLNILMNASRVPSMIMINIFYIKVKDLTGKKWFPYTVSHQLPSQEIWTFPHKLENYFYVICVCILFSPEQYLHQYTDLWIQINLGYIICNNTTRHVCPFLLQESHHSPPARFHRSGIYKFVPRLLKPHCRMMLFIKILTTFPPSFLWEDTHWSEA